MMVDKLKMDFSSGTCQLPASVPGCPVAVAGLC
jgi:hypothetical protein